MKKITSLRDIPVEKRTEEICIRWVKEYPSDISYINKPSDAICLAAVKKHGGALRYIKNQRVSICLAAIENDPSALNDVKRQTEKICMAAVRNNALALFLVIDKSQKLWMMAISVIPGLLKYIDRSIINNIQTDVTFSDVSQIAEIKDKTDFRSYFYLAEARAKKDGLQLTNKHWAVLVIALSYYENHGCFSTVGNIAKGFDEIFGKGNVNVGDLLDLFSIYNARVYVEYIYHNYLELGI